LNGCSDQNVILSDPLVFLTFYLLKYFHYFTEFIEAVIALFQNQSVLTATTLMQDYISIRKHANIMVLAHEDDENVAQHPYWYARVLGIFHVNVRFDGQSEPKKTEFLWVHWYG
jgi:hypothetical protein